MPETQVIDLYKKAIAELQKVIGSLDADDDMREAAGKQIRIYRTKVQGAALDEISSRTANLQALVKDLTGIADKATSSGASECVKGIRNVIAEATGLMQIVKGV